MPHDTPLIATLVGAFVLAFVLGAVAQRLKLSPLVGYLLAGVLVGPFTPGFVADEHLALELAEIGVILLMFGVGLHFSLSDLLSVKAIAIPGAVVQIGVATLMGMGLTWAMGWNLGAGIVFGIALSVASTVVLLRALQERRMVESEQGRIAVGWLIVEDLAMVLALVLLPALSGALGGRTVTTGTIDWLGLGGDVWTTLAVTLVKVAGFVVLMLVVGRRVIPWIMHWVAHIGSRELFRLAVLAIALGVAFGSAKLFGVSFALGAFFAGMVLSESPLSHRAAEETLPLRDAFAVLFFVSVGMLVDPSIVLKSPIPLLVTVLIVLFGKSIAAFLIVRAFGYGNSTAFTISASLAQIGEFSFILVALGVDLQLLPAEGRDLILAAAIISILANPFFFLVLDRYRARQAPLRPTRP
ncbi:cation:proton antiporter, partial [Xanthobacter autotrophicus]|uniref:cation:proton antiporter domain-containing protein n=1 Tax=Xanthobacter autotrophicus TaxID=280 RepID=UPI001E4011DC